MDAHGAMLNEGHRCQRCGGNVRYNPITEDQRCILCCRSAPDQEAGIMTEFFCSRRSPRLPASTPAEDVREVCHAA